MLRFKTKGGMDVCDFASFSSYRSVKKVAGVELDARLVGIDIHHAAGGRLLYMSRKA
jgi:hypothetical protein